MIIGLDIETMGNPAAVGNLPEPKANGRLKDPAKIAADIAEKKAEQIEKMALDPLAGRICSFAMQEVGGEDVKFSLVIKEDSDDAERYLIESIFDTLTVPGVRLLTLNGYSFDLPFIYKRAVILALKFSDTPPLAHWTRKYNTDHHIDLAQVWQGWANGYISLDLLAKMILGAGKLEHDVTKHGEMIKTEEGRAELLAYNVRDVELTVQLFERIQGVLIA